LRIAILAQSYEPARGGGPRWTTELSRGLAARGHEVLVLTRDFPGYEGSRRERSLEVRYLRAPRVRGSPIFGGTLLDEHLRPFAPEIVQTSAPSLSDMLMPPPSRYGAPYATLFHAQLGASLPAKIVQAFNLRRLQRGEWSGIAVTSAYWQRWLTRRGVPPENVAVIPSTVSAIFSSGPVAGAVREPGALLFAGGLDGTQSYKRFDLLVSACELIAARSPELSWNLQVVGDGNLRAGYERDVESRGLRDRIVFLGSVSDDELHRLYSTAALTALPSSDVREGWGLVLAEALCCGSPILLTSGIGGAETFGAAPGAIVVAPGRAEELAGGLMRALRAGPDDRDAERIAYGAQFHAERVVSSYEAMYDRMLDR
jgi:glycosyltransferase involved in cell wall biosynthesis